MRLKIKMRHNDGSCPFCGGGGQDEILMQENSTFRKKIDRLTDQISIIKKKNELQEDVIREQIRAIYDYIKPKKINPS